MTRLLPLILVAALLAGCSKTEAPAAQASPEPVAGAPLPGEGSASAEVEKKTIDVKEAVDATGFPLYGNVTRSAANFGEKPTQETRYEILQLTSDSVDQAAKFYQQKMNLDRRDQDGIASLMGKDSRDNFVLVTVQRSGEETQIMAVLLKPAK